MTLTIFKNDDFESVGFKITNNGEYVYHHGIQSGWSKDVPIIEKTSNSHNALCALRQN